MAHEAFTTLRAMFLYHLAVIRLGLVDLEADGLLKDYLPALTSTFYEVLADAEEAADHPVYSVAADGRHVADPNAPVYAEMADILVREYHKLLTALAGWRNDQRQIG